MSKFSRPFELVEEMDAIARGEAQLRGSWHGMIVKLVVATREALEAAQYACELDSGETRSEEETERLQRILQSAEFCEDVLNKYVTEAFCRLFHGKAGEARDMNAAWEIAEPRTARHVAHKFRMFAAELASLASKEPAPARHVYLITSGDDGWTVRRLEGTHFVFVATSSEPHEFMRKPFHAASVINDGLGPMREAVDLPSDQDAIEYAQRKHEDATWMTRAAEDPPEE